jgi:histidinol-phosphate aminotransferase
MINDRLNNINEYKPSSRINNKQTIKLDWNECNIPYDKEYLNLLSSGLQNINLSEYPDIQNDRLINNIANYCKISPTQVQLFNGSDSALHYIFASFLGKNTNVLVYTPNYTQIETYINLYSDNLHYSQIDDIFGEHKYNFDAISDNDVIYISNPNNPTGYLLSKNTIRELITKYPEKLFIIDEAYFEFAGETCIGLIENHNNIIITRTFSKAFSLASIRLGYMCANKKIISIINKIRNTKEVNSFAQELGNISLENIDFVKNRIIVINENKKHFQLGLDALNIKYAKSKSNFILVKLHDSGRFLKLCEEQNILIRDRNDMPGLKNCVRITIGTIDEINKILNILYENR